MEKKAHLEWEWDWVEKREAFSLARCSPLLGDCMRYTRAKGLTVRRARGVRAKRSSDPSRSLTYVNDPSPGLGTRDR